MTKVESIRRCVERRSRSIERRDWRRLFIGPSISPPDRIDAIRQLSELGIRRTLSAGSRGFEVDRVSLEDRLAALADAASAGRATSPAVEVVPCGGVRCDHAARFLQAAGHLHASCLVAAETTGPRCFSLEEARGLRERVLDWIALTATD